MNSTDTGSDAVAPGSLPAPDRVPATAAAGSPTDSAVSDEDPGDDAAASDEGPDTDRTPADPDPSNAADDVATTSTPRPAPAEHPDDAAQLADLIRRHADLTGARRLIIGLAGGPGSGKSTAAARLQDEFTLRGEWAAVVPMDGFHLSQRQLLAQGLVEVKGAPETFDAYGYLALLQRLRAHGDAVVYAPTFDRTLDESVAGAIAIAPEVRYVITEGNYLLHDEQPWPAARAVLDTVWFLDPGEDIRVNRLVRRHIQFGRTPNAALRRATTGVDAVNAEIIAATRHRADLVITS
ncbi:MAG: nucleoside/nucleotide kinase family protein [Nakamurella sp.]